MFLIHLPFMLQCIVTVSVQYPEEELKSMKYSISSDIFLKKIGSGMHKETQNSVGEGEVLVIAMPGKKKVPEHHSDLSPAEKELP
jgi:hypothetical protein